MTPEHDIIKNIISMATKNVKESDVLLPVFFLGSDNDKELQIIGTQFSSYEEKQMTAAAIRKLAERSKADFVLFVAESYMIKDQKAAKDYMDNMEKYNNSMSNHPKAVEIVMFALETKQKVWTGMADILPGRELGITDWKETPGIDGTFANLLGEKPILN